MYRVFYGLKKSVFSKEINTQNLFIHDSLKELQGRLDYMKKYRGLMLVTGGPGTGKTTALRYFVDQINHDHFMPVYIPLSTVAIGDFYKQLNDKLNGEHLSTKSLLFKSIQERILHYSVQLNKVPVIMIDEAHLLKNDNFYELQIISNFNMDSLDPALFILIAQSHLNDRLNRTILEAFNQRINMKFSLNPLSLKESQMYIQHHLKIAGASDNLFNDNAYKALFNLTGGVIRKIGHLVIKTLSLGAVNKKHSLTEEDVLCAPKEL